MTTILRVQVVGTGWSGAPGLNTVYWRPGTSGGSGADAVDCAARVRAMWNSLAPLYPSTTTWTTDPAVDAIDDQTGNLIAGFSGGSPAAVNGSGAGDVMGISSAALIRLNTNEVVNGRFLKGRWFISPLIESCNSPTGGVTSATITTLNAAALATLSGGTTASFPVVWHRPGPAGLGSSFAISSVSTWNSWASLRSRRD